MSLRQKIIAGVFVCALAAVTAEAVTVANDSAPSEKERNRDRREQFRFSGVMETGVDIHHRTNRGDDGETELRSIARGQLDISARPVGKVRAEMGIEYNQRDTFLTIDKFYAQYNVTDNGSIRAGIMKKSFGMEERAGVDERYFHRRSIISRGSGSSLLGLKDFNFLSHDLTLQYRHSLGDDWRFVGGFAWSPKDSAGEKPHVYFQNYSAHYTGIEDMDIILAAVIRHADLEAGLTTTFISSLSLKYDKKFLVSEAELTFGTNPQIAANDFRDAYILGIRIQEYFPIALNNKTLRQVIPIAEAALYWNDLENGGFDTQIRGGVTLGFAKDSALQFRNTFGVIIRDNEVRRYRFDSQAVVIF